jgi:hypothetical protein
MVFGKKAGEKPLERTIIPTDVRRKLLAKPWVSLRRNQLIPVNKAVYEKEHLEKGLEEDEKKLLLSETQQRTDHCV